MMKRILILALVVALPLSAQTVDERDRYAEARKAATDGLAELAALLRQMPQGAGITAEEASRAQLQQPLRVLFVRLDDLRAYGAGSDASALLRDTRTLFHPVSIDGVVRTSVSVVLSEGRWKPAELGRPKLAAAIERVRPAVPSVTAIVHVPALNLSFVASESGGTLRLTSLQNNPDAGLRFGEGDTVDRILAMLVPFAQRHNGDPT